MSKKTKYLVIGAGKMGGALLQGWLDSGAVKASELIILDPNPGKAAQGAIQNGALHLKAPSKKIATAEFVLLGIKPQMFAELAPPIAAHLPEGALVISILAGTSLGSLEQTFTAQKVIRTMPNTPASIGKGITAYTCGKDVSDAQTAMTETLLAAGGPVHHVESEQMIDMVTAVSGSGPAYIFHLVEALEAAAIKIGLPNELATALARQTVIGAAALLDESGLPATQLRQNVTSPNGTTQAALDVLMGSDGLPQLMRETVQAALKRAKELGQDLS